MARRLLLAGACLLALAGAAGAQSTPAISKGENLGDLRADLAVLNRQITELRQALVASGPGAGLPRTAATPLTRLDQLESELRRITNRVDVLSNDVERITADAANRLGDMEFRITELEGGDVSLIGKPEPLGGGVTPAQPAPPPPAAAPTPAAPTPGALAVSEQADFDAAKAAAAAGDNARAAELYMNFLSTYPGGPLAAEAQFRRAEALAASGQAQAAARSYLDTFSGAPQGPFAPPALLGLADSLGKLGKTGEACLTLAEVENRFPGSQAAVAAPARRTALGCR